MSIISKAKEIYSAASSNTKVAGAMTTVFATVATAAFLSNADLKYGFAWAGMSVVAGLVTRDHMVLDAKAARWEP